MSTPKKPKTVAFVQIVVGGKEQDGCDILYGLTAFGQVFLGHGNVYDCEWRRLPMTIQDTP